MPHRARAINPLIRKGLRGNAPRLPPPRDVRWWDSLRGIGHRAPGLAESGVRPRVSDIGTRIPSGEHPRGARIGIRGAELILSQRLAVAAPDGTRLSMHPSVRPSELPSTFEYPWTYFALITGRAATAVSP